MGLIQQTTEYFTESLRKAIGEEPVLKYTVNRTNVVVWYEDIEGEENHSSNQTVRLARFDLMENMTNGNTLVYTNGNGQEIPFRWDYKGFERVENE